MSASVLPLSDIVRIVVNLSPRAAIRRGFNLGLIVGTSDVISPDDRVKLYSSPDHMIEDGFTDTMPEYRAALKYFSQNPAPTRLAVGRHVSAPGELTGLTVSTMVGSENNVFVVNIQHETPVEGNKFVYKTSTPNNYGEGNLGDAQLATIPTPAYEDVLAADWQPITNGEEITATAGDFIMVAEVNAETNAVCSVGTAIIGGLAVPLDVPPAETVVDAIRACRHRNTEWYLVTYCGATPDEIFAIAQYVESASPYCCQFYTTDETLALTGNPNSIFARLRALNYMRSLGQWSETPDAVAGIMGWAMGANTRTSRSAYTLKHKRVTGVAPDNLNLTQVDFLQRVFGNYYVSRGHDGEYTMFEQGTMANGTWFDEVLNLDMLVNDMQLAILDLLVSRPKIPQTEEGMNDIKLAMTPSLRRSRMIGFIAPGQWNGPNIWIEEDYAPLQTGDRLESGWAIFSEPVDNQSQADRDTRIAPPIYVPIKLAGAIHTVLVRIDVNR